MSDEGEVNRVLYEINRIEEQITDLNNTDYNAVHHFALSMELPRKFKVVQDAERNLLELRKMSWSLAQSYADNAENILAGSDISASLEAADRRLAVCYFVIGVSKVFDAIAQFWGGPYAKLVTDLKTPIADIGKELTGLKPDPKQGQPNVSPLVPAQIANVTLLMGNALDDSKELPFF